MPTPTVEEMAKILRDIYRNYPDSPWLDIEQWIPVATHVLKLIRLAEIEARINEADEHLYDSTIAEVRIAELQRERESGESSRGI